MKRSNFGFASGLIPLAALVFIGNSQMISAAPTPKLVPERAISPLKPAPQLTADERRPSQLTCNISAFISADRDDMYRSRLIFEGRGLLTCQNENGFTSELPLSVELEGDVTQVPTRGTEISLSGNSSTFVIPREINQIQDSYSLREVSPISKTSEPRVLLRGNRHDLVIEMKLSSRTNTIEHLKVSSLKLRFDDSAPELKSDLD